MPEEKKIKSGPIVLLILDGWGIAPSGGGNAIAQAKTPNFKDLVAKYPATILTTDSKVNIGNNYLAIGTGKQRFSKNNSSIFDYFSQAGMKWQVLAEPEKLAHGSFFINNKKKIKDSNFLVVSAGVSDDYQNSPAMATELLTNELLKKIKSRKFDFILAIPANLDLVAHSGNFPATVEAAEIIDQKLNSIVKTVLDNAGVLLVTASHGHAEEEQSCSFNNSRQTIRR
jgi:bisphosphoglycerate-independent phosphoglycerate mutase (AlkP superfamily)